MYKTLFSLVALAVLGSSTASAQENCHFCLEKWNIKTHEPWSCSSPDNPSGGAFGIITSDVLGMEFPWQCSHAKWCAAACPTSGYFESEYMTPVGD